MRNGVRKSNRKTLGEGRRTLLIVFVSIFLFFTAYAIRPYSYPPFEGKEMPSYPVHGVDVSAYQGDIDWNVLYRQGVSFAFIKATEGSSFVDDKFHQNWDNIYRTPIRYTAYHFTSFESPGETQAENFISQVDKLPDTLPPVIDVEYYGDFIANPPSKSLVLSILVPLIEKIESHYGVEPIIYTNRAFYIKYIEGTFDNPVWIADLNKSLLLPNGEEWDFLQYTFEGELEGYSGSEKYIDLNVFNGTYKDLLEYE